MMTKRAKVMNKLCDIKGKKTPDYIILKVKRNLLKHLPDNFFMDLTIEDVRDATPNPNKKRGLM